MMEIRSEPYNLQIKDKDIMTCPCCNLLLQKEIRKGKYLIDDECGYCTYSDRPFASNSSSLYQHYPSGCSCTYGEQDYLYISCENCKSPICMKCKTTMCCSNIKCGSIECDQCIKKTEFNNKWKTTMPQEKLNLYGIEKLKILAKNKKIKGYSTYKKHELINILSSLVNENDFPIKSMF